MGFEFPHVYTGLLILGVKFGPAASGIFGISDVFFNIFLNDFDTFGLIFSCN